MSSSRFARVREVFEAALDRPAAQRLAFVAQACGADTGLRAEIERLLLLHAAEERDGSAGPPGSGELLAALAGAAPLAAGTRLGTWRLLRVLGAGGMGEVWEAEQDQPRRRAAVKVMRAGPASARARARFRDEIDALARLQHPRIARILEAGDETTGGTTRLWYAMELVPGARPLSEWLAAHPLPWRKAVALVSALCEAIEHGHRNGVIHRDLKPGNILIGQDGRPRVIDFGVARITEHSAGLAARTQAGELVGTLASMAPEQLDGRADVRSDIYGLGMVLYELLAKGPAYDVGGLSLTEAMRRVRETVPRPPGEARPELPVELNWITGKALEKDPELRYASAAALSEDLRRVLADEPVLAGALGRGYRLRKFVRRHRVGVGLGLLIAVLLVGGIAGTTSGWLRALDNEQAALAAKDLAENRELEAAESAREADAVAQFLVEVFGASDPALEGNEARVVDALALAEERMHDFLVGFPRAEARVRTALGQLDDKLGRYDAAEAQIRRALELRLAEAAASRPGAADDVARLRHGLGTVLSAQRRFAEADAELQAALGDLRARHGPADPSLGGPLSSLASLRNREGRVEEAEQAYRDALAIHAAAGDAARVQAAGVQANFASLLLDLQRVEEAEALLVPALETLRAELGPGDPRTLTCLTNLGGVRHEQQRWGDAAELMQQVVDVRGARLPPDHPVLLSMQANLATLRAREGRPADALALLEQVLAARLTQQPAHAQDLVTILCNIGNFSRAEGDEAVRAVVGRLLECRVGVESTDPRSAFQLENFARFLDSWALHPEALELLDEAAVARGRLQAAGDFDVLLGRALRTRVLVAVGRPDDARAELVAVHEAGDASLPPGDRRRATLLLELGRGWQRLGANGELEALALEAVGMLDPLGPSQDLKLTLDLLAKLCDGTQRPDEAAEWRERLAALQRDEASP